MHHIGPKAAQTGLHLAAIGMLTQKAGQPQQAEGIVQGEGFRADPLGQGGALRFGDLITHLTPLEVGAVLAKQEIDLLAGFRVFADRFRAVGLLLEDQLSLLGIEVGRGDLLGQGGLEQFFGAVLRHPLGFQVGPKPANAHHTGQPLQDHRARHPRINVAFPLLDQGLEALVTLEELGEVGQPLFLAGGDVVEAVLHLRGEAGVHQLGEVLLQQGRHRKGGEAGGEGVVLEGGVTPVGDGANDAGVGRRPANALFFEHLHQGCLAVARRGLGLVAQGFDALAVGGISHRQGRQQHLLALKGRIGIVAALHVGPEEAGEINPLARGPEGGLP